jgi:hypothetical protein
MSSPTATPTKPPTSNSHYAAMRRYQQAASSISVQLSVRRTVGAIAADEFAELRAQQDEYYRMAAAYRSAGRRRERADRFWATRPGTLLRITVRGLRAVRSAVTV